MASYARAADEERGELDLVDDVMFTLVPEDDKKTMWSACAKEILARHDVRLGRENAAINQADECAA